MHPAQLPREEYKKLIEAQTDYIKECGRIDINAKTVCLLESEGDIVLGMSSDNMRHSELIGILYAFIKRYENIETTKALEQTYAQKMVDSLENNPAVQLFSIDKSKTN